jgi:5,10-methylenetetrahydrofolate reductase
LKPVPAWKLQADFLFTQVGFSVEHLLEWRAKVDFSGPVYAGVMVVASAAMAHKMGGDIAQLAVPPDVIERLEEDRDAGIDIACEMVTAIRDSGAFTGVHLIPVRRYREVARRLEATL